MKPLRHVVMLAIAGAVYSAAPTSGGEPNAVRPQDDAGRRLAAPSFARPAPATGQDRQDPKWVDSMQRLLKDLTDDNARLRTENEGLRADNLALKRQLEAYEDRVRRGRDSRGAFEIPPEALRQLQPPKGTGQVPPEWRPFEFNGATYYMIPLRDGQQPPAGRPATESIESKAREPRRAAKPAVAPPAAK